MSISEGIYKDWNFAIFIEVCFYHNRLRVLSIDIVNAWLIVFPNSNFCWALIILIIGLRNTNIVIQTNKSNKETCTFYTASVYC